MVNEKFLKSLRIDTEHFRDYTAACLENTSKTRETPKPEVTEEFFNLVVFAVFDSLKYRIKLKEYFEKGTLKDIVQDLNIKDSSIEVSSFNYVELSKKLLYLANDFSETLSYRLVDLAFTND